jgi:hypothetical protein
VTRRALLLAVLVALVPAAPAGAAISIAPFPARAIPDYQLGGAYPPAAEVTVVARDSTEAPDPARYSVCYLNGFQTQPGATWPTSLLLRDARGRPRVDPGWPDEHILDIGTAAKRARIAARLRKDVAGCAKHGFQAVEFDNLDSYTRSHRALTRSDAVAYATLLVRAAHAHGLAAGQKNTPQLGALGRDRIGFDFAVAEECDRYRECGRYTTVYGDRVIDIEYADDLRGTFAAVCARAATPPATILRDRALRPAGRRGHVYRHC